MRYQQLKYSCGAAAIVNCLRAFGHKIQESKARKLANTTVDGTYACDIVTALRELGYAAAEFANTSRNHSYRWLIGALSQGSVVILSVDIERHWVAAVGMANSRVILIDSVQTERNRGENGIHILSRDRLMLRWRSSRTKDNEYFGIVVSKLSK